MTCPRPNWPRFPHFFEHYKDLEPGRWVRIDGWYDVEEAKKEIMESLERYGSAQNKPQF